MEIVAGTTSSAKPSGSEPLPAPWIDRLFGRLAGLYGKLWLDAWAGIPIADVRDAWADALAGVGADQIRMALRHVQTHNKFPPSAPEFSSICRQFRVEPSHRMMLPAPQIGAEMPAHVAGAMADIKAAGDARRDYKRWAKNILADETGTRFPSISYQFAREALGVEKPTKPLPEAA